VLESWAAIWPLLVERINAHFGISLMGDDLMYIGKFILKTEKSFNEAAGFTNADNRLPEFQYCQ